MNITLSIIVVFFILSINTSSSFSVKHYKNAGFKSTNDVINARNHLLGGNCYLKEAPAATVVTGGVTLSKRIPPQQSRVQSKTLLHAFSSPSTDEIIFSVSRGAGSSLNIASLLHQDDVYVLSFVMLLSTFGLSLERRTKIGKALSAPLATMAMALVVANIGIVPFSSPVYDFINKYFVALAIPLLLYDSNIRRVLSDTGSLLVAFLIGAVSTVIGTIITYPLFPLKSLGSEGWKIASALAARHIGGAINFVAVCETLNVSGSAISASIAADNVVVALYFALLFSLATQGEDSSIAKSSSGPQNESHLDVEIRDPENVSNTGGDITMPSIAVSLTVASCLVTVGKIMTRVFFPSTSSLPLISIVTVIAASLFPKFFQSISFTGTSIGVIFMQMFFAASGAAGSIRLVMKKAPSLFLFSLLQVAIHFISLIGIGRVVLKLNSNELYLASNANVGGPTTAAAMAQAKEWKRLVLPALLIGILGYATATPIALGLGQLLKKMPIFGS